MQFLEDLQRLGVLTGIKQRDRSRGARIGVLRKLLEGAHRLFERLFPMLLPRGLAAMFHRPVVKGSIA